MALLELKNVSKSYGKNNNRVEVLKNINLEIKENEFIAIVGYSGSGKTTLINILAGLDFPDSGKALYKGEAITEPNKERGIVFQNYSLLPWLTVSGNVMVGVKEMFPHLSRKQQQEQAYKYIEMVGLTPARNKLPAALSGGMRQRVSVARALALTPEVLLLDEPLSALDALTRSTLQDEFAEICEKEKKTILLITNDVDEAIILADRVIALTPGPGAQLGKDFKIDIPRPRNKVELNKSKDFIDLRNSITGYLVDLKIKDGSNNSEVKYKLPDLRPKKFLTLAQKVRTGFGNKAS